MSASGIRNALPASLAASAALVLQKSVASMSARVVASSKADLLPTRGRVGGYVELAAFVPAREPAEFGGGADIRIPGENRVERDVAVVERLVAGLQPVLFKDLEFGRDHEWDKERVDPGCGWHFLQRGGVRASRSQHVHAWPERHDETPPRHSPRIALLVHKFLLPRTPVN